MAVIDPVTGKGYIRDPATGRIVEFGTPQARAVRTKELLSVLITRASSEGVDSIIQAIDSFIQAGSVTSLQACEVLDTYIAHLGTGKENAAALEKVMQFRKQFQ